MILTCPDCATRYFVDDAKVGPEGRTVRCTACGRRWTARAGEVELELRSSPEAGALAEEPRKPAAGEAEKSLPLRMRQKQVEKKSMNQAMLQGMVWASMAAILIVALALSVVFKVEVVRLIPRAASAYAMAGLRVNATGLAFEEISAAPGLQDGHAALVVSGAVRNIEERTIATPPLRIEVFDSHGKKLKASIHALEDPEIAAGEARHFVIAVLDPPAGSHDVEVTFVLGQPARKAPALRRAEESPHGAGAHPPVLRPAQEELHAEPVIPEAEAGALAEPAHAEAHH